MTSKPASRRNVLVSSLLRIHPRFMRSVHLERDINDSTSSLGYILTPVAQQSLERIASSFDANSTQRAWRVAGDFGTGKTNFALILARAAKGTKAELPPDLRQFARRDGFMLAMATGDNEPLGVTVLRALGQKTSDGRKSHPSSERVLAAVHDGIARARRKQFSGLLLVVDELGKNLEHAARNPEADDIFLLQRLAEEAARSGDKPFVVVVILHQGVAAYASGLDTATKREWDKVAGRFEEVVLAQPIEQVTNLVAATLNVDTSLLPTRVRKESESAMAAALKTGLYGTAIAKSMTHFGPRIFPLHSTTLPVLVRSMRRFGQNERSIFSFISSAEPMGLQQHASRRVSDSCHYRISHLFDYVAGNLLPTLTSGSSQTHWGVIEAVMASTPVETPEEEAVLKTVAMLNLLDAPDLPATEQIVQLAVDGDKKATVQAIKALRTRGALYDRGAIKGLCLWPHTSVNLDEAFSRAIEATAGKQDGIKLLCDHVQSEHLVPRAYYAETGTLRYAEVKLVPAGALADLLADQPQLNGNGADLNIRVVLPADKAQQRSAKKTLCEESSKLVDGLLITVAEPLGPAVSALTDLVAWNWVKSNTPQLLGDRYAYEEVTRQIGQAEKNLRLRLRGMDNLAVPSAEKLYWFSKTVRIGLSSGRRLLAFLGRECARIYPKTPRVLNELINRRAPSSAAVAARTKLVELMATASEQPSLGMDETLRPAEMAIYLSVLKAGGFHVENDSGWVFRLPTPKADKCKALPALDLVTLTLTAHGVDALVPVPEVFKALSRPPFGIREGLHPIILAIYLATHHQRVALYEDGTYLHEVGGDEFLRLTKQPQFFRLQYCELEGVRAEVFKRLLKLMQFNARDKSHADLIDLVRPLVVFISREVPEYCRKTNNLPATAVAVRRALLDAREPVKLIFTLLPEACGLPPIGPKGTKAPDELAARLSKAMNDIRTAYANLMKRLGNAVCAAFGITSSLHIGRPIIAGRAAQLAAAVTEPSLKVFALRLCDAGLPDRAWIESVANLLASKSAERWTDNDEAEFHHQLEMAAGRFKRTELALVGTTHRLNGHACRIALTKSDGTEVGDLVNWDGLDESQILPVEKEIQQILTRSGRLGLAAAMRVIWGQLDPKEPQQSQ